MVEEVLVGFVWETVQCRSRQEFDWESSGSVGWVDRAAAAICSEYALFHSSDVV